MWVLSGCAELRPSNHKEEDLKMSEQRERGSNTNKIADTKKAGAPPDTCRYFVNIKTYGIGAIS